ncbi:hypothetical protein AB1Y20_021492 [Prymnesium parvum]|uniref:Pseudouridine synthase RsuA/RluA-like domain-containing protein n=1 Tax=Prymnesium parvum TaxID=97485 RepID=A0AB34JIT8_PRYPA
MLVAAAAFEMSLKSRRQRRRSKAATTASSSCGEEERQRSAGSAAAPATAEVGQQDVLLTATPTAADSLSRAAKRRAQKRRAQERKGEVERHGVQRARPPRSQLVASDRSSLPVVFEDESVLAVNKPAGMVCHPCPGFWQGGSVIDALETRQRVPGYSPLAREMLQARARPTGEDDSFIPRAVVHRLDRGTTGLLVLAKTTEAEARLAEEFRSRGAKKRYVAIVFGKLQPNAGSGSFELQSSVLVDAPIAFDPSRPGKVVVGEEHRGGKPARSIIHLHGYSAAHCLSLVSVELLTGRTHQIRAHCAYLGAPIVNDGDYAAESTVKAFRAKSAELGVPLSRGRPLLHAYSLQVNHPERGHPLALHAPLPPDMAMLINKLWPTLNEEPQRWPDLTYGQCFTPARDEVAGSSAGPECDRTTAKSPKRPAMGKKRKQVGSY